jgi:hypothetical protein
VSGVKYHRVISPSFYTFIVVFVVMVVVVVVVVLLLLFLLIFLVWMVVVEVAALYITVLCSYTVSFRLSYTTLQ